MQILCRLDSCRTALLTSPWLTQFSPEYLISVTVFSYDSVARRNLTNLIFLFLYEWYTYNKYFTHMHSMLPWNHNILLSISPILTCVYNNEHWNSLWIDLIFFRMAKIIELTIKYFEAFNSITWNETFQTKDIILP